MQYYFNKAFRKDSSFPSPLLKLMSYSELDYNTELYY